jgi:transposase-like protein
VRMVQLNKLSTIKASLVSYGFIGALEGELTDHLGYPKHAPVGKHSSNSRNGSSQKTLKGDLGEIPIDIPCDREGGFEPQLIRKYQTRFDGFDDKIVAMYAREMTTRDIQPHLTKGSVIGFDELNSKDFPGETTAFQKVLDANNFKLINSKYSAGCTYLIYE